MKNNQPGITKRLVAAMLVAAAVVGVSALAMHTPTHNRNSMVRSLKSIQTDKAILFYADNWPFPFPLPLPDCLRYVERVPAMTGESKALTENLKLAAATL